MIFGYGNPDRQDDGVAWHILRDIGLRLGRAVPNEPEDEFVDRGEYPVLQFNLQLTPEMSETFAAYDAVCFVDAHTGNVPNEVNIASVEPNFQSSPFTHHLTPASCLSMSQALYHHTPDAILVSVRGYFFGFSRSLSTQTAALKEQAVEEILTWLSNRV